MNRRHRYWPWRASLAALVFASAHVTVCALSTASGQELRFADLGTCALESGEVIRECSVGYRILSNCEPDRCEEARETYFLKYIAMLMRTPGHWNRNVSPDDLLEFRKRLSELARNQHVPVDKLAENTAMRSMDITAPFGGSMQQAAGAVRSRMLIIVGTHDLAVTPEASREFAGLAGASLLELDNDWGHQFFIPDHDTIRQAIQVFLR